MMADEFSKHIIVAESEKIWALFVQGLIPFEPSGYPEMDNSDIPRFPKKRIFLQGR